MSATRPHRREREIGGNSKVTCAVLHCCTGTSPYINACYRHFYGANLAENFRCLDFGKFCRTAIGHLTGA